MSQITRCPACATTFKVVADQLRISEGWVRCGQCKEVFDASAHLLPDDVSGLAQMPATVPKTAAAAVAGARSQPQAEAPIRSAVKPKPVPSNAGGDKVLSVPAPVVPAFLAASPSAQADMPTEPAPLQMSGGFAWPAPAAPLAAEKDISALQKVTPTSSPLSVGVAGGDKAAVLQKSTVLEEVTVPSSKAAAARGYELPFPPLHDWDDAVSAEAAVLPAQALPAYPDLDASAFVVVEHAAPSKPSEVASPSIAQTPQSSLDSEPFLDPAEGRVLVSEPLPTLAFPESTPQVLVPPTVSLPSISRSADADNDDEDTRDDEHLTADELSFVRTARRQAFWRKPLVRVLLGLGLLTLTCALILQVGLHQRDRLAALNPKARLAFQWICGFMQCELAPVRQIADLVIDSSSFNKGRGDLYQLGLTIKNRAGIALAMPAVELTLTDAQDQPVLRRVLYPGDLAAPPELAAQAEWSATIPMSVASNGYRITGYRLVAFYP
jgi:predicted Zn finger-like uncharacterized protein